jgi:hypothetical protein
MISILTQAAITVVAWLILMFISTNLTGLLVKGFFPNPQMEKIVAGDEFLTNEYQRDQRWVNIVAVVLIILLLAALYYFWNIGLVIAALMLMAARVPDLIWEIKNGRALQMGDMKRPRFYVLSTLLPWVSLPVLWYALYRM